MEPSSDIDDKSGLADQLHQHCQKAVLFSTGEFLPHGLASQLVTEEAIRKELAISPKEAGTPLLVQFIRKRAKLVFLTAVTLNFKPKDLRKVMKTFQNNNFNDDCLPVHEPEYMPAFTGQLWKANRMKQFTTNQWKFKAPIFAKREPFRTESYSDEQILPFIDVGSRTEYGTFSEVFQTKIHKQHCVDLPLVHPGRSTQDHRF
ncbi:hypothetical protein F5883DRAFT_515560 [Diaporthe sp. PMI_573]|nr:hypothetical protein F5883DRAFT_515560 [Diaporthaceae sp. PMI_573]